MAFHKNGVKLFARVRRLKNIMSKVIFSGLESSGKSLKLAMVAEKILFRNIKWLKKSGIARPMAFNFSLSELFTETARLNGIPIKFWENLDDLIELRECDVFIDEIGTYFDARLWTELSLDVRRWIQQGAKMGIELYGAAQDFAQVDISFRRLVSELYLITKLLGSPRPANTKPPIKRIWGLCSMVELDPQGYDEKNRKFVGAGFLNIPHFFFIRRHYCELFNTKFFIKRSKPLHFKHQVRYCPEPGCNFQKIYHT